VLVVKNAVGAHARSNIMANNKRDKMFISLNSEAGASVMAGLSLDKDLTSAPAFLSDIKKKVVLSDINY
jgi:hypothetical protein